MGALKCLSGLKMGAYIPLISKSFTFVDSSVQKFCFCFEYFSCRLDRLIMFVSLFNELCDLFSGYLSHENIGESNCRFGARGSPIYLYVVFPVNWKGFSPRISLSALCSSRVGIGGSFFYVYSKLILWYICT